MKANDTQIFKFLEGSKQFRVPLFQRTFSWEKEQIQTLWNDIQDTKSESEQSHFFGSFVTLPIFPSPASGISKYVIIDGQQRLVAIAVFLSSLRERIMEIDPESKVKDEIYELYLVNKFYENPEDKYKIVPTQADRSIFFSIIDKPYTTLKPDTKHLVLETYGFFQNRLSKITSLEELKLFKDAILRKFLVVDICLEKDDDPYLIFESLNAKGSPLTQADLVRNYLFMRINTKSQQKVYDEIWFPMQQNLKDYLEPFVRHYLAMGGTIPNFNKIYATFQEYTDRNAKTENDVIALMKNLAKFSNYYSRFVWPEKEVSEELREQFEKLNKLKVTTSYPFLLRLYDDYSGKRISLEDLSKMLTIIEKYIVKRAVCGIPTHVLNRYFPTVYKDLDQSDIVKSLETKLKKETGSSRMPDDNEFKTCLKERKLYGNRILRYLLEEIEKHDNKEVVDFDELQVEHIMPQKLSDDWKKALGDNWEFVHQKYLDTLGNLTLTGYNPEYSNKTFIEKREMEKGFKDSNLQINRDLAKLNRWTEKEIKNRAERLSEIALKIFL